MAIPTREEFDEILELLSNFNGQEMNSNSENIELNFESIRDYYLEILDLIHDKRMVLNQTPVKKWLERQSSYTRGMESAFGKEMVSRTYEKWRLINTDIAITQANFLLNLYRDYSEDEFLNSQLMGKEVLKGEYLTDEGVLVSNVEEYNRSRSDAFRYRLFNDSSVLYGRWLNNFIVALRTYFYGESDLITRSGEAESLEQLKGLLNAVENLQDHLPHYMEMSTLYIHLSQYQANVAKEIEIKSAVTSPIKQNNETVKERALVYELWRAFEKQGLGSKVTAITHFLTLEGVSNSLDRRTIERNISRWKREDQKYIDKVQAIELKYNPTPMDNFYSY